MPSILAAIPVTDCADRAKVWVQPVFTLDAQQKPVQSGTREVPASYAYLFAGDAGKFWLAADDCKDDFLNVPDKVDPGKRVGTLTKVGLDWRAGREVCGARDICQAVYDKWLAAGILGAAKK